MATHEHSHPPSAVLPAVQMARPDSPDPLAELIYACLRQWRAILLSIAACLAAGLAFLLVTTPLYTSTASILIARPSMAYPPSPAQAAMMPADIASEVELLKSRQVIALVIDQARRADANAFQAEMQRVGDRWSALRLWARATAQASATPDDFEQEASLIQRRVQATRSGDSSVITLSYAATRPDTAARMAALFAEAFIEARRQAKASAARQSETWLMARLEDLRIRALAADRAAQDYRAQSGLAASDGRLLSDQALAETNAQMILARTDVANAEARSLRLEAIIKAGDMEAAVAQSLESPVIDGLRKNYLDASRKASDIASRLGPEHRQVVRLKREMAEYRQLMFEELSRIAAAYRSDVAVAIARRDALAQQAHLAGEASRQAEQSMVTLRNLESQSAALQRLYQTTLAERETAQQQQSQPETDARIISPPSLPTSPSSPVTVLVLAISLFGGVTLGGGVAVCREMRDTSVRTLQALRTTLGLPVFGLIPIARTEAAHRPDFKPFPLHRARFIRMAHPVDRYVLDQPLSQMADTLSAVVRRAQEAKRLGRALRIGVVSTLPGEGKTTVAINLAAQMAMGGASVLLVDGDHRKPGATLRLAPHATKLTASASLRESLLLHPDRRIAFLPTPAAEPEQNGWSAPNYVQKRLEEASALFDAIIIDLPPLTPLMDAEALAPNLDHLLFVVAWGSTTAQLAADTLTAHPAVAAKCMGAILNKVDLARLPSYQPGSARFFANSAYHGYFSG